MKLGSVFATAVALWAVSAPLALHDEPQVSVASDAPQWLLLPEGSEILSGAQQGAGQGQLILAMHGDSTDLMDQLRGQYAQTGYVVTPVTKSMKHVMIGLAQTTASDPYTGRRVELTLIERPAGDVMSVAYHDPIALR